MTTDEIIAICTAISVSGVFPYWLAVIAESNGKRYHPFAQYLIIAWIIIPIMIIIIAGMNEVVKGL